jgi:TonB family protein
MAPFLGAVVSNFGMELRIFWIGLFVSLVWVTIMGQSAQQSRDDLKRCIPKAVSHKTQMPHWNFRPGEKYVGMPLVSFEVLASGDVSNARVKRTSGVRDIDASAVNWIKSFKYNKRPGCPVIDNEMGVNIHFTGG